MKVDDVPIELLKPAEWNANEADEGTLRRLGASLARFGIVVPLVVRPLDDVFEVLSGNQRLRVLREQGATAAPCVEVQADDTQARLLAQALNRVHGEDDLNKKAALVRDLLAAMDAEQVAAILPDTAEALQGLAGLGQPASSNLAEQLSTWAATEAAKAEARLHVTSFPFSDEQKGAVEDAIDKALALRAVARYDGPNKRAAALVHIAQEWAAGRGYAHARGQRGGLRVVSPAPTQHTEEG